MTVIISIKKEKKTSALVQKLKKKYILLVLLSASSGPVKYKRNFSKVNSCKLSFLNLTFVPNDPLNPTYKFKSKVKWISELSMKCQLLGEFSG